MEFNALSTIWWQNEVVKFQTSKSLWACKTLLRRNINLLFIDNILYLYTSLELVKICCELEKKSNGLFSRFFNKQKGIGDNFDLVTENE